MKFRMHQWIARGGILYALAACAGAGQAADVLGVRPPNVLFIAVDDLRPQLGCYGETEIHSPHLDRLAAQGTVFERAYCNVPVCGPSRVSVLTGIRATDQAWWCKDVGASSVTLPAHFKAHGYYAIANGKVLHHENDRKEDWSEAPWRSEPIYHGQKNWAKYNTYGLWQDETSAMAINPKSERGPYCEAADVPDDAYQDGKLADRTIGDLKRLKEMGKPFFLACGFWRPHLPLNAPKKYWDLYHPEEITLASNRFPPENLPSACTGSGEIDGYGRVGERRGSEAFDREARHAYYACVSYVDAQIGRVLDELEELGLADHTIVVVWGDHGWNLGEHRFWGKHNTMNNSLRSPLIVRAPGARPGNRTQRLVEFVDIYPSLCELAGIPIPSHVEGASFVPLLTDPMRGGKQALFAKWVGCEAVKTDRYLYTEWKTDGDITDRMLYDHQVDPDENVNIAGTPQGLAVAAELSLLLRDVWVRGGASSAGMSP